MKEEFHAKLKGGVKMDTLDLMRKITYKSSLEIGEALKSILLKNIK